MRPGLRRVHAIDTKGRTRAAIFVRCAASTAHQVRQVPEPGLPWVWVPTQSTEPPMQSTRRTRTWSLLKAATVSNFTSGLGVSVEVLSTRYGAGTVPR